VRKSINHKTFIFFAASFTPKFSQPCYSAYFCSTLFYCKVEFYFGISEIYCIKIITVDFAPLKPILPFETLQDWINELIIKTFCVGIVGATAWFFQNFEKVFRLQTINASSHENNLLLRKSLFCNENYQLWSFLRAEWNCNIYERPFATCCLFTALILSLNSWKNILKNL
jgi:hypothetical protein